MKLKSVLLYTAMFFSAMSFAQQTYFVQVVQEPYQDLQGATVLTHVDSIWNQPSFLVNIPFPFTIGVNTLDSISVMDGGLSSENVLLELDSLDDGFTGLSAIIAMGADMVDRAYHDGGQSISPISFKNINENGNDILVIEYKNVGFLEENITSGSSEDYANFQIRLIEDNTIEIHYGESHISSSNNYFDSNTVNTVAIMPNYDLSSTGNFVINENLHILTGDPLNPDMTLINAIVQIMNGFPGLDSYPVSGTKYIFSKNPNFGQDEIDYSEISILNPLENTLEYTDKQNTVKYIKMINLQGETVLKTDETKNINISHLASGLYIVQFNDGKSIITTRKIIKS